MFVFFYVLCKGNVKGFASGVLFIKFIGFFDDVFFYFIQLLCLVQFTIHFSEKTRELLL